MKTFCTIAMMSLATASGCKSKEEGGAKKAPAVSVPKGSASSAGSGALGSAGSGSAAAGTTAGSGSGASAPGVLRVTQGLATPESVLHDPAADLYLVANINGKPLDADDNGYVARISPDGKLADPKWIDGGAADVTLNAPKGMALSGGRLWIADIDHVRTFDAATGRALGQYKLDGVSFLNDVAADGADGVYVSDSGLDATFASTGTDAIYRVDKDGKVSTLIKTKDLGGPNGIALGPDGKVWVNTFGTGEVYTVDAKGAKQPGQNLPKGQLDGLIVLKDDVVITSSWAGQVVYRGKLGGAWVAIAEGLESPADIAVDEKRQRLLVPLFMKDTLVIRPL